MDVSESDMRHVHVALEAALRHRRAVDEEGAAVHLEPVVPRPLTLLLEAAVDTVEGYLT